MANDQASGRAPPYASYASFANYIELLGGYDQLPGRIDKSAMSHLNYGTQQALMAALRYFKLLGPDDAPTALLEALAKSSEDKRPAILIDMLRDGYPYLCDGSVDLSRATSLQVREKLKDEGGVSGSTVDKAMSFFLSAAQAANLVLSPHLSKGKGSNGGSRRSRPRRGKAKSETAKPAAQQPATGQQADVSSLGVFGQLMTKFPALDPAWPDDIKAKWFTSFERLMKAADQK